MCGGVPVDTGETRTSPRDCFSCPLYLFFSGLSLSLVGRWCLALSVVDQDSPPSSCQFFLCIYPDILFVCVEDGGESVGHACRLVRQCGATSHARASSTERREFVLEGRVLMMSFSPP